MSYRISTLLLAATLAVPTFASAQSTQPSAPTAAGTVRDYTIVAPELKAAKTELAALIKLPQGLNTLRDPAVREKLATAGPLIRKVAALDAEAVVSRAEWAKTSGVMMMGTPQIAFDAVARDLVLLAIGDETAVKETNAAAASPDAAVSRPAKGLLAANEYLSAADEKAQLAAVEKLTPLYADANGKDEKLDTTLALLTMARGGSPAAEDQFNKMLSTATPGKFVNSILRQRSGDAKQKAAQGKPATFTGTTIDGKSFDSSAWKGKVILIDFWASWCGPCKAELPHLKELYAKYHDQGLEVLGISNDYTADALTNYLASNPLPWNSLFDEQAASTRKWHPITQSYGITGIPVMFIIDRKGILHSTTARGKLDTLIPQLLNEKME